MPTFLFLNQERYEGIYEEVIILENVVRQTNLDYPKKSYYFPHPHYLNRDTRVSSSTCLASFIFFPNETTFYSMTLSVANNIEKEKKTKKHHHQKTIIPLLADF